MSTQANIGEITGESENIKEAARKGKLKDVIILSTKYYNDTKLLSEALVWSCWEGHFSVVRWLVENTQADVKHSAELIWTSVLKEESNVHYTPLTAACENGHLKVVEYLIETSHVDVNLTDRDGYTPLTTACESANMLVSKYLLRGVNDTDVNLSDKIHGNTALHWAVWCSYNKGLTPLHDACYKGDIIEVDKLDCVMCDHLINQQNNHGYTPLHLACYYGYSDVVKALMIAGADETITNDFRATPAQLAKEKGHEELLYLLDRVSLWESMLRNKLKSNKLTVGFLTIVAQRQMMRKIKRNRPRWYSYCFAVRVVLMISRTCN